MALKLRRNSELSCSLNVDSFIFIQIRSVSELAEVRMLQVQLTDEKLGGDIGTL